MARNRVVNISIIYTRAVPSRNEQGEITNWFGTKTEITEQIVAREKLETVQEELRGSLHEIEQIREQQHIAISQAKLGTFRIDGENKIMTSSERLKEIFGYRPDEEMSYEAAVAQISPEHRDRIVQAVKDVFEKGADYDEEYTIISHHDGKKRWVKATGKLYTSEGSPMGHFSGTLFDITEQKEDELRKNDFIAMVSHELKTPLTSLSGFIQMLDLKARKGDQSPSGTIIEKAMNQVRKMTTMINGFLNVSRLESGKIHIDSVRFDMKDLVREIEEETVAANSSHHIIFHPVQTTWVNGDRDKIGQVITNFLSNALKYSPAGTTVQVACVYKEGNSQVSVSDEGQGIAPNDAEKIFDRYYRVENRSMREIAGFGIGLYLCAEIVRRHHGRIWVASELQKGSTFYFAIPVTE
ncbi:ATP-binding protein [Mucilaginibacter sp. CAU 1740]|uniref:sensor histidine kinase n=1 Tax=Mucilaginibacter sp. CAU 1740 TaxID=3140365 RepID=UPI00325C133B